MPPSPSTTAAPPPPPPPPQSAALAALPLMLTSSFVAFVACSVAAAFGYAFAMVHRRRRDGRGMPPPWCGSTANNANSELGDHRSHHRQLLFEPACRLRNRLRLQLTPRLGRPLWSLPAVLELAEASALVGVGLDDSGGCGVRRRRDRRDRRRDRLRMRPAAASVAASAAGVRKAEDRRRRRRRRHRRRSPLLSRIFDALASNQTAGLRVSHRPPQPPPPPPQPPPLPQKRLRGGRKRRQFVL